MSLPTNHRDLMLAAFSSDEAAVQFALIVCSIADTWDDLIDEDRVHENIIHEAFINATITMPGNDFYRRWQAVLSPVMLQHAINWINATELERLREDKARRIAHHLRHSLGDMLVLMAYLIGGVKQVREYGPALRQMVEHDELGEYLKELSKRDAAFSRAA
jgi:hypothetical protein